MPFQRRPSFDLGHRDFPIPERVLDLLRRLGIGLVERLQRGPVVAPEQRQVGGRSMLYAAAQRSARVCSQSIGFPTGLCGSIANERAGPPVPCAP